MAPTAPAPVIGSPAGHPAGAAQQPGARAQGDFDIAVSDHHIGHRCPGNLQQAVKCSTDAHAVPPG